MISVVIPTCDRPKLLNRAIKSVLNQKIKVDEIIVVNNGKKILNSKIISKKVKIINTLPYIGPAKARNIGVKTANHKFIVFLDDDDAWPENYIKIIKSKIKTKPSDCYITRSKNLYNKNQYYKDPKNLIRLDHLFLYNPGIGGSNIIVKKKLFNKIKFDHNLVPSEDKGLIIDLLINNKKISIINDTFVYLSLKKNYYRISNLKNYIKGKISIYFKYKEHMSLNLKVRSIIIIIVLYLKSLIKTTI